MRASSLKNPLVGSYRLVITTLHTTITWQNLPNKLLLSKEHRINMEWRSVGIKAFISLCYMYDLEVNFRGPSGFNHAVLIVPVDVHANLVAKPAFTKKLKGSMGVLSPGSRPFAGFHWRSLGTNSVN